MNSEFYEIVVPLFDDEKNFYNLIKNIQTFDIPLEKIIVVASGKLGRLKQYRNEYGFRLLYYPEKLTPGEARNIGAQHVSSKYVAFLDSDILVTESWVLAINDITSVAEKPLVGDTYHISSQPNWIEWCWFEKIRRLKRSYINGGNLIIKTELFEELGGFDPRLETGEDYDLCRRASAIGNPCFIDNRLIVHHEGNPKSIRRFLNRERWHARGDLTTVKNFINSTVMVCATTYMLILIACVSALVFANLWFAFFGFSLLLLLTMSLTVYKFGWFLKDFFRTVFIMNIYLAGRAVALIEKCFVAIRKKIPKTQREKIS